PDLARHALKLCAAWVAGNRQHALHHALAVSLEVRALLAERHQGVTIAAEQHVFDLAFVWIELLARALADGAEQLERLLLADTVEASLRLSAFAMAVLHEALAGLGVDQRFAAEEDDAEAAQPPQYEGARSIPLQQIDE